MMMMLPVRLRIAIFTVWLLAVSSAAAPCYDCTDRYRHFDTYQVEQIGTDVVYSQSLDRGATTPADRTLHVWAPAGDTETNRPLIICIHGGSFMSGNKNDEAPLARYLASLGYVTASIEYRLGMPLIGLNKQNAAEAVVMAVQDFVTAVRWFRKSAVEGGNPYGINPDMIFSTGTSAGALTNAFSQYMDEESQIPDFVDMTLPHLVDGGLTSNSSDHDNYSTQITAIACYSGSVYDTAWMAPDECPAAFFHGADDEIVPYGHDTISVLGVKLLKVHGGYSMHLRAEEVGMTHCWHQYTGAEGTGHAPHVSNDLAWDNTTKITRNLFGHFVCGVRLECDPVDLPTDPISIKPDEGFKYGKGNISVNYVPGSALINIKLGDFAHHDLDVSIFTISGKKVLGDKVNAEIYTIEHEDLSSGIYFINVTGKEEAVVFKLLIQ